MRNKGFKHTEETKRKIGKANSDENNGMWKGDKAGLIPLHIWVKRRKPKPKFCEKCKKNKPYDLANISGKYKRDVNDFKWLCRSCHMKEDGRINNLKQYSTSCYICGKDKKEKGIERYDYAKKKKVKICKSCSKIKMVIFK